MSIKLEVGKTYLNTKNQLVRIVAEYNSEKFGTSFIGVVQFSAGFEQPDTFLVNGSAGFTSNIHAEYDEYAEWNNLPIDAKIFVDGYGNRYFSSFNPEAKTVEFFGDGATSWSTQSFDTITAFVCDCTIVKD